MKTVAFSWKICYASGVKAVIFLCVQVFLCQCVFAEVVSEDPVFYLKHNDKKLHGPFVYREKAKVGQADNVYRIIINFDESFSLESEKTKEVYGPFNFEDGAKVLIGKSSFVLVKQFALIKGNVTHPDLVAKRSPVHLVRLTDKAQKELAGMKTLFLGFAARYDMEKQPYVVHATMRNCRGVFAGSSSIVEKSDKVREFDRRKYDARSRQELNKFFKKHSIADTLPNSDGIFFFGKVQPGNYIICCEGSVKNTGRTKIPMFIPVIWWAETTLNKGDAVTVHFGNDDACDWSTLFADDDEFDET
ncbi:hypothetical protein ACFLS1_03390 [Verrucomicrobiota bacterium]